MEQQLWCWGRDVERPEGNLLMAYGFERHRDCAIDPCLLYTSPSPRDGLLSRMPSSA